MGNRSTCQHRTVLARVACLLALAALMTAAQTAESKEVRCSCKSVKAEGYGSSSCSANESGGQCRVEFNEFTEEALRRSAQLLQDGRVRAKVPPWAGSQISSFEATRQLSDMREEERFSVVLTYLGVAAIRNSEMNSGRARNLVRAFDRRDTQLAVAEAFDFNRSGGFGSTPLDPRRDTAPGREVWNSFGGKVYVAPGCVSVRVGDDWYMYKALWSPVSVFPQCGER